MGDLKKEEERKNNAIIGGVIGFIVGIPLSYYFQGGLIRFFVDFPTYVEKLPRLLTKPDVPSDVFVSILLSIFIFTVIFSFIGYTIKTKN